MKASITVCCYLLLACVDIKKSISWDSSHQRRCAFHSGANSWRKNVDVHKHQQASFAATSKVLAAKHESNNIIDTLANAIGIKSSKQPIPRTATITQSNNSQGQVIRTAARPYQSSGGSLPSSRYYTTRKSSLPMISVSEKGAATDYNHYRTVALKSTQDRAISILTHDVSSYIQTLDGGNFVMGDGKGYTDGDLGENVLVKGVDFAFFKVGHRYRFSSQKSSSSNGDNGSSSSSSIIDSADDVVIEITEPMEPCANLCKLPYINDPALPSARDRVVKCQRFIEALGVNDGLRGWYAKVLSGGIIRVDDSVSLIGENV